MSSTTAHTGHERRHLPETYLRLSGQGLKLAGQGKHHLIKMAHIAHNITKNNKGRIGAAIIHAIGHITTSKAKNKRKAFGKKVLEILKKHHFPNHSPSALHGLIAAHKHRPLSIKDIFGKDYAIHSHDLLQGITHRAKRGSGVFGDIGKMVKKGYKSVKHVRDKAINKLKQFAAGKTKFKPSQLANYLAGAVGAVGAASALIPGIDLISVPTAGAISLGLKSAGTILKTSGRGSSSAASRASKVNRLPAKIKKYVQKNPSQAKQVLSAFKADRRITKKGSGRKMNIALGTAGAIMLYGFLKDNAGNLANIGRAISAAATGGGLSIAGAGCKTKSKRPHARAEGCPCKATKGGSGLSIAGSGIPERIKTYMKAHPQIVKRIAKRSIKGDVKEGSGASGRFAAALGLAGTSAAAGAYGMYHYLMEHPSVAAKIAAKGVGGILSSYLKGGAIYAGMGDKQLPWGVTKLPSGKVKKDRYSVYYGYYNKTGGGLTKDAFALKGKKVVSKKQQEAARRNMNFRRKTTK